MTYPIKLTVLITTYNHEKYVAQAIQSVLDQKVNCNFEIIISDDHSVDKTRYVAEEYQKRYLSLIRLLSSTKNLGITKNLKRSLAECQGEYIAILEGDDYWISPYKLQKQIDFLDQHTECSLCFNGLLIFNHDQMYEEYAKELILNKSHFKIEEFIETNGINGTFSSCMYRNDIVKKLPVDIYDVFTVDWMFNICCAQFGLIGCIPSQMTAYRVQGQGFWSSQTTKAKLEKLIELIPVYDKILKLQYTSSFMKILRKEKKRLRDLQRTFLMKLLLYLFSLPKIIFKKIYRKTEFLKSLRP